MYNPQDPVGKVTETMAKLFAVRPMRCSRKWNRKREKPS